MAESQQDDIDTDIAAEDYRGPSHAVVALGSSVVEHNILAAIGLASGTAIALLFPQNTTRAIDGIRHWAEAVRKPTGKGLLASGKAFFGMVAHGIFGEGTERMNAIQAAGNTLTDERDRTWFDHAILNRQNGIGGWFFNHSIGLIPPVREFVFKHLKTPGSRAPTILTIAGVGGIGGYLSGVLLGAFKGVNAVSESQEQLARAQDEIVNLRQQNAAVASAAYGTVDSVDDKDAANPPAGQSLPPSATPALRNPTDASSTIDAATVTHAGHPDHASAYANSRHHHHGHTDHSDDQDHTDNQAGGGHHGHRSHHGKHHAVSGFLHSLLP